MAVMRAVTSGLGGALGAGLDDEALQHVHRGDDFAFDALIDDGEEERPDVGGGAEVVAAVAHAAVDLDEVPVLQLLEAGAHVGACDGEGVGDFFGGEGLRRQVEQGVHLGDGAVDSPAGTHFAPVEDEFLHGTGQRHVFIVSDISVMTEISDRGRLRRGPIDGFELKQILHFAYPMDMLSMGNPKAQVCGARQVERLSGSSICRWGERGSRVPARAWSACWGGCSRRSRRGCWRTPQ